MLRLNLAAGPEWLELAPGVRIRVAPCTTALMMAARSDPRVEGLPDSASNEERAVVFAQALATLAVLEWEGVGDADGNPLDPSPESIGALLDLYPIFERFQLGYVAKGLALESEKNVSAPAPTGTSAGATPTARRAPAGATTAPAASTARKRSKAGRSGT